MFKDVGMAVPKSVEHPCSKTVGWWHATAHMNPPSLYLLFYGVTHVVASHHPLFSCMDDSLFVHFLALPSSRKYFCTCFTCFSFANLHCNPNILQHLNAMSLHLYNFYAAVHAVLSWVYIWSCILHSLLNTTLSFLSHTKFCSSSGSAFCIMATRIPGMCDVSWPNQCIWSCVALYTTCTAEIQLINVTFSFKAKSGDLTIMLWRAFCMSWS